MTTIQKLVITTVVIGLMCFALGFGFGTTDTEFFIQATETPIGNFILQSGANKNELPQSSSQETLSGSKLTA